MAGLWNIKFAEPKAHERRLLLVEALGSDSTADMISSPEVCACPYTESGPSLAGSCGGGAFLVFMGLLEALLNGRCDLADPCRRARPPSSLLPEYDFVVVGGGVAGPVVAARLSENPEWKVLLLEAGGEEPVASAVPSFYSSYWDNPEVDWRYRTQPQKEYCQDQEEGRCKWMRGKTLGGGSVINGMMYHRGHAADYEGWVSAGAAGWGWRDVLPYFHKAEDYRQGDGGRGGPIPIQRFRYQPPLAADLLEGAAQAGFPVSEDLNGPQKSGFAVAMAANEGGSRVSMARAYLRPASNRTNLHVLLRALATKVLFSGGAASGVQFYHEGKWKTVRTSKEVILTAGALNTPQLLMLSGVGPKETLERLNIAVVADLPGVGSNLQNHVGVNLFFNLDNLPAEQDLNWAVAMEYMLLREGPMAATGITQVTGMLYSSYAESDQPDLQFFFNGLYANCSRFGAIHEPEDIAQARAKKSISITGVNLLPRSKGYVTLNSSNPFDAPLFYPNYFSDPVDMEMLKQAARAVYKIAESEILRSKWGLRPDGVFTPRCAAAAGALGTDAFLECMVRVHTDPQNHQAGTARIGAVLDPRLRLHSLRGLRVADASAMPTVVTGNPFAAIVMIAERAADFIKEDWENSVDKSYI